jgi:pimeloyl-ACP methyl ester carboxylesterase
MLNFVLVHGSCQGGWCWKKVAPILCKDGYFVHTPTLTGLGERSHLVNRDIGLHTHILDIIQVIEYEDLDEVILVGHSYGGLVIGGVAEKIPQRIRRLVYLDAYVPQDNKNAFDLDPGVETINIQPGRSSPHRESLCMYTTPFFATQFLHLLVVH